MKLGFKTYLFSAVASLAPLAATAALAQSASSAAQGNTGGEIIVTAQKRAEVLQSVPIAIAAKTGQQLANQQIHDIGDLSRQLPNVDFGVLTGNAQIAIRGIGYDSVANGNEGRVAYEQDGVYIARPEDQVGQYFDVNRVEVLYGPQGTLYGRNATGGVVNVITNNPGSQPNGYVNVTGGNYGLLQTEGAVGGPITDRVGARFAFTTEDHQGYGRDLFNNAPVEDNHSYSLRGKVRVDLTNNLRLTVAADYSYENDHSGGYSLLGIEGPGPLYGTVFGGQSFTNTGNPFDNYYDVPTMLHRQNWGIMADAQYNGPDNLVFESITAYRNTSFLLSTDVDGTSAHLSNYYNVDSANQISEEFRISQQQSKFNWQAGVYYLHQHELATTEAPLSPDFISPVTPTPPLLPVMQGIYYSGIQNGDSIAGFGTFHYDFTEKLAIDVGARYSYEQKQVLEGAAANFTTPFTGTPLAQYPFPADAFVLSQSHSWSSFTPAVTLSYKPDRNILLYAKYSEGFKSGGFNLGEEQPPFNPETISAYEGGLKATWFNQHLLTDISGFYYSYTNLQVQQIVVTSLEIINAASATVKGLEFNLVALPVDHLRLEAGIGLLDATYTNFNSLDPARAYLGVLNLSGNKLNNAPDYTINIAAEYTIPTSIGDFTLRAESKFVDKEYLSQFNLDNQSAPAHSDTDLFLRYKAPDGHFTGSLWVKNLENKIVATSINVNSAGGDPIAGALSPPRTLGVTLGYGF